MPNGYWIEWNGVRSDSFDRDGCKLIVRTAPNIPSPRRKFTRYSVAGRNGDIYIPQDAWDNISIRVNLFLYTPEGTVQNDDLRALCIDVAGWLHGANGYAKLRVCEESGYYEAFFTGPYEVENLLFQFGRATIDFNARPEHYLGNDIIRQTSTDYPERQQRYLYDGYFVAGTNPTIFESKPTIAINKEALKNTNWFPEDTYSLSVLTRYGLTAIRGRWNWAPRLTNSNAMSVYEGKDWLVIDSEGMRTWITDDPWEVENTNFAERRKMMILIGIHICPTRRLIIWRATPTTPVSQAGCSRR